MSGRPPADPGDRPSTGATSRDRPALLFGSALLCGLVWSALLTWDQWQISRTAAATLAAFYALLYGALFAAAGLAVVPITRAVRPRARPWSLAAVFLPVAVALLAVAIHFFSLSAPRVQILLALGLAGAWLLAAVLAGTRLAGSTLARGLWTGVLAALALLAGATLWGGPHGDGSERATLLAGPPRPLVARLHVLGFDGLDPDLLERLIEEVPLPSFARLRAGSASARVETLYVKSPEIWTSYVTGRPREVHGVDGFHSYYLARSTVELPRSDLDFAMLVAGRLFPALRDDRTRSSMSRRVPALWELASEAGLPSVILNWWATYPVAPFAGVMVTPHALPWGDAAGEGGFAPRPGSLWPPAVSPRIVALLEEASRRLGDPPETGARPVRSAFEIRDAVAWGAYQELCRPRVTLCMVYLQAIDVLSHAMTKRLFGQKRGASRAPTGREIEEALLEEVVSAYVAADRQVGAVLDRLGADEALVVVSDHGWRYDGTEHDTRPDGVVFLVGEPFRGGFAFGPMSTLDVFPLLSTLLGLPLSEELEGRLPEEALGGATSRPRTVATYGPRKLVALPPESGSDEDQLDELRSLGYIQ